MKQRLKRLEDDAQVIEEAYLQQVSQSDTASTYRTVAAAEPEAGMIPSAANKAPLTLTSTQPQRRALPFSTASKMAHVSLSQPMPAAMAANIEMPKADRPGQCFVRMFVPPQYKKVNQKVVVREATERVKVIPAKYAMEEQQVLISEASETLVVVPATYRWAEERVQVKPATIRVIEVPATYKDESRKVLVQPEHSVWKQQLSETNGEIMSLVKVPAVYKTVSVQVIDQPATIREIHLPAEYKTVKRRVVDQPVSTRSVKIAAKYQTMMVEKQIEPPKSERVPVSAEYSTVTKTRKVKDGHLDWREVLCDDDVTPGVISQIQQALKKAGFNPGPVDGFIGQRTIDAINRYQRQKNLPVDQYLNVSTLKAMGIDLP